MKTKSSDGQRPWISKLAVGLALIGSGCTTPWGELGAVDDDDSGTTDAPDPTGGETGDGGQTSGQTSGAETGGDPTGDEPPTSCELDVGSSFARAMTPRQYENTVADVLGLPAEGWSPGSELHSLDAHDRAGPFEGVPLDGAQPVAAIYQQVASDVAEAVDPALLLPCDPATPGPDACAVELVTALGRQLWRRPLEPGEVDALLQEYEGTDLLEGTRGVVEALLASPSMWTLQEAGTPWAEDPDVLVLDSWSLATRMAFFLWNSTPDEALLARAEAGALSSPMARFEEAERMLDDPRADRMLGQLYRDWLDVELDEVEKSPELFPEYGPELAAAMEHEVQLFVSDVVLHGDSRLHTLLNAPFTYVDSQLRALYDDAVVGNPGPLDPGEFVRVDLDPQDRGGLLTLPGVMARHSGEDSLPFTARGLLIRSQLLCQQIPPPPPDIDLGPVDMSDGRYAAWEELMSDPACAGCHQLTDPLSFAFDEYDPIGRWQDDIAGEPVQTAGELLEFGGSTVSFSGRAELTELLTTLPDLTSCAVRQHVRFALRRELGELDECAVEQLTQQVEATDGNLRVLMRSLVVSEHFGLVRPQ